MWLRLKRHLGTGMSYAASIILGLLAFPVSSDFRGLLLVGALVGVLGRRRLEELFWTWVAPFGICRACGQGIPLVARWKCGCGYLSPKARHAFGRCVLCHKAFRWVVCPACDGSVLL
jgi:hypothetical protein